MSNWVRQTLPSTKRAVRLGIFFILLALICNGWSWTQLIPNDSLLNNDANEIFMWVVATALLIFGAVFIQRPAFIRENIVSLILSISLFCGLFVAGDVYLGYLKATRPSDETIENVHLPDDKLGWQPKPNSVGTHRSEEFDVIYRLDERGFKRVENEGPATATLYFFGDSYTFGHGVTNEDTFPNIIAEKYVTDKLHVYNTAVMGYGIVQMYQRFLSLQGELKPGDLVIFTPLSRDIERNIKDFMFPAQFVFNDDFLQVSRYPYYNAGTIGYTDLGSFSNKAKALLFQAQYSGKNFQFLHRLITQPNTTAEARLMLESVKLMTEAKGAKFALIFLPRRTESRWGRYDVDLSTFAYYDVRAYFPSQNEEVERIGFEHDSHWNRSGHQLAAIAIVDTLVNEALLEQSYLRYTPQTISQPLGDEIILLRAGRRQTDKVLELYLIWDVVSPVSQNYTAFVQLLDEGGNRMTGVDRLPERSFLTLKSGEKMLTHYTVPLPDIAGHYEILTGLYYFEDGQLINVGAMTLPETVTVSE